ncbi:DeoR family transcriptional regulator [Rubrobacter marinus]|uniref:Lactose phosphotransferase system repressor n=1 Tax=Rubrobacter marinus TaxID=2653852 RepID=A0A6G8Q0W1_9ACTN|nr:DeoR/GlpR family DNA-binding transcription regulator [Rubrobacter marinus]QIN80106.1 DeoR family transcriptional regulator [Rubrobacter marinus]
MLKEERRGRILEMLGVEGKLVASDLSVALGVSEDTVRRDLRELAEAGKLRRVHGGALPRSAVTGTHEARRRQASAGKVAVARAAVGLVENGQVIILDGGTTALEVVRHLPAGLEATVVTHSPTTAAALAEHPNLEVVVIGGTLYKDNILAVGAQTVEAFASVNADLCLQGIWSMHPEVGVSHPYYEEMLVKRAMIESADRVVALASAEKLGTASSFVVAPATAYTHLATDHDVPEEILGPFRELGLEIAKG